MIPLTPTEVETLLERWARTGRDDGLQRHLADCGLSAKYLNHLHRLTSGSKLGTEALMKLVCASPAQRAEAARRTLIDVPGRG